MPRKATFNNNNNTKINRGVPEILLNNVAVMFVDESYVTIRATSSEERQSSDSESSGVGFTRARFFRSSSQVCLAQNRISWTRNGVRDAAQEEETGRRKHHYDYSKLNDF